MSALLALLLFLAAEPSPDDARLAAQHFEAAEVAFGRGDYTGAALSFERAFGLAPHPVALLNAAEAWERAGQRARAMQDLERVLTLEKIQPAQAGEARRRIERLEPKIARLEVEGPAGWSIELDGEAERRALPLVTAVEPGERAMAVYDAEGRRTERRVVELVSGGSERIVLEAPSPVLLPSSELTEEIPPHPPPPVAVSQALSLTPEPPLEPSWGPPAASWVAFSVAGVSLIATAVFGGLTLDAKSRYDGAPSQEHADAFFGRRTGANVSIGLTLVGAATGAVIWWLD